MFDADAIRPGSWAMDVGARNFDISKFLARRGVWSVAVEADPNLSSLNNLRDLETEYVDRVQVLLGRAVVGTQEHLASPSVFLDRSGNIYAFSIYTRGESRVTVPTVTVEGLMREYKIDTLALLKLDCEGAEYGIMEDVVSAGLRGRPLATQVSVEFHHHCGIYPPGVDDRTFEDYLSRLAGRLAVVGYVVANNNPMDMLYVLR